MGGPGNIGKKQAQCRKNYQKNIHLLTFYSCHKNNRIDFICPTEKQNLTERMLLPKLSFIFGQIKNL